MAVEELLDTKEMRDLIETLMRFLPEIVEQLTQTSGIRPSLETQLRALFAALESSNEDLSLLDQLLEKWIDQYTEAEVVDIVSDITDFLHAIEMACIRVLFRHADLFEIEKHTLQITALIFSAKDRLIRVGFRKFRDQQSRSSADIQSMLEKLERSKSNFISIAAHELKTPLTIIEGYTMMLNDLLTLEQSNQSYIVYLEGIQKGTERLKQIIQDMIDVSLIDSRMLLLNFQPCLLNRMIETVVEDMKRKAVNRYLLIQWQPIHGIDGMIYLDEVRLSQALRNVIENAIKYTPDGGRVSVYGRKLSGFVEIMVEDTGIGVDPEDQTLIFEKFAQLGQVSLHSTGKSKFKGGGAGLGLPIAKGILEAHGGTIWMESEGYDEIKCPGSVFHLMVPIYIQPPKMSTQIFSDHRGLRNGSDG
ncbi:MAG: hypothetical protein Kow0088_15230 [Anaerolineales bacterium]